MKLRQGWGTQVVLIEGVEKCVPQIRLHAVRCSERRAGRRLIRMELVDSAGKTQRALAETQRPAIRIERITKPSREAIDILEEYYAAVDVMRRDTPAAVRKMLSQPGSGMWLAWMDDAVAGCVALRPLAGVRGAGECKRLYVRPWARGHHVAERLMDALEEFARELGMRWVYLDTHDGLKAAIALYRKRGYRRCPRYNDNPQATLFLRRKI